MGMFRDSGRIQGANLLFGLNFRITALEMKKIGPKAGEGYPIFYYVDPPVVLVHFLPIFSLLLFRTFCRSFDPEVERLK